jgi:hypothetical protein
MRKVFSRSRHALVSVSIQLSRSLASEQPIDDAEVHRRDDHSQGLPNKTDVKGVRPRRSEGDGEVSAFIPHSRQQDGE